MGSEIVFAQVLTQLMSEKYQKNRSALAAEVRVSPSALSQYARNRATPSLETLVGLAEALGVSLDMLVLGREHASALGPGYLTSYIETGIRRAQADSATLYDLVARIGAALGEQVLDTARELLPQAGGIGGTVGEKDAMLIERCSTYTSIVTVELDKDILRRDEAPGEEGSPSLFTEVVAANIQEDFRYEYFVPRGAVSVRDAEFLRRTVAEQSGLDLATVERRLSVVPVNRACVPGFVVYDLALDRLERQGGGVYERVRPFLSVQDATPGHAFVATVIPASNSYQYYGLVEAAHVTRVRDELKAIRDEAKNGRGARDRRWA